MSGVLGYSREAVRVRVKKYEMNLPPEWRKFSVDPQITSLEVLYSLLAKASTASIGKFQERLPKDRKARGLGVKELLPGVKRKASHLEPEKKSNLDLVESVLNKRPKVDIEKAISLQKRDDRERREAEEAESTPKRSKKGKSGKSGKSKFKSKGVKKPKGGKGQRNPNKRTLGRKRR